MSTTSSKRTEAPRQHQPAARYLLTLTLLAGLLIAVAFFSLGTSYSEDELVALVKDGPHPLAAAAEVVARELKSVGAYPLEPEITIEMSSQPEHNDFDRFLTFKDHTGAYKRLKVSFRKKSGLVWESVGFPNGIRNLEFLAEKNNRSFWDRIYLENRGGSTTLPIKVR